LRERERETAHEVKTACREHARATYRRHVAFKGLAAAVNDQASLSGRQQRFLDETVRALAERDDREQMMGCVALAAYINSCNARTKI
jgi:hypothetical protein